MTTYSVTGVTHQVQLNPRACWYTCMQMMVYYFQNQQQQSLGDLSPPEYAPEMKARFDAGLNPSWVEWRNWATRLGFTALNYHAQRVRGVADAAPIRSNHVFRNLGLYF